MLLSQAPRRASPFTPMSAPGTTTPGAPKPVYPYSTRLSPSPGTRALDSPAPHTHLPLARQNTAIPPAPRAQKHTQLNVCPCSPNPGAVTRQNTSPQDRKEDKGPSQQGLRKERPRASGRRQVTLGKQLRLQRALLRPAGMFQPLRVECNEQRPIWESHPPRGVSEPFGPGPQPGKVTLDMGGTSGARGGERKAVAWRNDGLWARTSHLGLCHPPTPVLPCPVT